MTKEELIKWLVENKIEYDEINGFVYIFDKDREDEDGWVPYIAITDFNYCAPGGVRYEEGVINMDLRTPMYWGGRSYRYLKEVILKKKFGIA